MRRELRSPEIRAFRRKIYQYYEKHGRSLPWRETENPYHILVSEIMLQQTGVGRVREKYQQFIKTFPDFATLARAPLRKIFSVWQGLGYNRRALALKRTAQIVTKEFGGQLPAEEKELVSLPGIGKATAGAIAAFAFNQPAVFIETNIRTVFIHFFFPRRKVVKDSEILPLVAKTLDRSRPREWYYALMDYGVMLKEQYGNLNIRSAHHRTQGTFEGSNRQIRGLILRALLNSQGMSKRQLQGHLKKLPEQVTKNLIDLEKEGFIVRKGKRYRLAS